jgi:hypothetical protein
MPAMQLVLLLCEGVNEAEALSPLQRPSSHPIRLVRFARQGPKAAGSLIRTPSGQTLPRRAAEIRRLARWGSLLPDEEQRMIGMTPLRIEFCPLLIVGFLLVGDLDHDKYVRAAPAISLFANPLPSISAPTFADRLGPGWLSVSSTESLTQRCPEQHHGASHSVPKGAISGIAEIIGAPG